MIQETLQQIGLSKNETKIYLALLELGPCLMGELSGKTKIHRRNIYDSIEMLKDKGFVSSTLLNNRNVFEAVDPKRILEILDERRIDIESILPQLTKKNKKQSLIKVYSGTNGRKIIFEDKLNCKEEQYVLSAHKPSKKSSTYIENYHMRRIKNKIPLKMLFINSDKDFAKKFSEYKYIQVRLLPKLFNSPIAINIYGNKVAFLLGSGSMEPMSILIEDQDFSKDFKVHFEMLWKLSKKI